ncbi:RDD family protein [Bacteroides sedimenti]|uniref:RDD family protein n=1 Tax=Bacteroides sedimenti TaxID=2136147 RepID=A0ABN6ZFH4_9BACE
MADTSIITGQYVRINQTPASAGERILAQVIDSVIIFLYVLFFVFFLPRVHFFSSDESQVIFFILIVLPVFFYSLAFEIFNNGQSIGKKLLNIRVVMADGSTPTLSAYLLRWILFPIDLPITGGLGLVSILVTKNSQRLGDLAAGTMVVRLNNYRKIQVSLDEYSHLDINYRPVFPHAGDLSLEQINVIEKTLNNYGKERYNHITLLSSKIKKILQVTPEMSDEKFLKTLIKDYQYYAYVDI